MPGVEGPSHDPAVLRQRAAWRRALLATLFLAQGTPQLLAGDEMGNSQQGNNNAYCQDNATSWLDWAQADEALTSFVCALSALRRRYPAFRHPRWFQGHPFHEAGHPYIPGGDIAWLRPDGLAMSDEDWDDPWERSFSYVIEVGEGTRPASERVMVLLHPGDSVLAFVLPAGAVARWRLDTSEPRVGRAANADPALRACGPGDLCPGPGHRRSARRGRIRMTSAAPSLFDARSSGVLLHPTSLPGPHGCGDLGAAAYHFVDWLVTAGQSLWQVLPLNPVGPGQLALPERFHLRRQPAAGGPGRAGGAWLAERAPDAGLRTHPQRLRAGRAVAHGAAARSVAGIRPARRGRRPPGAATSFARSKASGWTTTPCS